MIDHPSATLPMPTFPPHSYIDPEQLQLQLASRIMYRHTRQQVLQLLLPTQPSTASASTTSFTNDGTSCNNHHMHANNGNNGASGTGNNGFQLSCVLPRYYSNDY
jgi:hypothetical protein